MQTDEKVIIIQGDDTKWYKQAVFIMNPQPTKEKAPVDLVAEAEKIVFNYIAKKRKFAGDSMHAYLDYTPPIILRDDDIEEPKRFSWSNVKACILMGLACAAMTAVVVLGWLR